MRILDSRNVTTREELRVERNGDYWRIWYGNGLLADDSKDTLARSAEFAMEAGPLTGRSIAWIGGGLCVGPRLFAIAECKQVVYEIEPALKEFCPDGIEFIPGDWWETISGRYDVIVYDLGGPVPRETLALFLAPGGVILPKED